MRALATWLEEYAGFWRFPPFAQQDYPWREQNPELVAFLDNLGDDEVAQLGQRDRQERMQILAPLVGIAGDAGGLLRGPMGRADSAAPNKSGTGQALKQSHFVGVPGRKAAQIEAFCSQVPFLGLPYVDWCAGKGHLARALVASHGGAAECLEKDKNLCRAGVRLAGEAKGKITFREVDVLRDLPEGVLSGAQHGVALHACGDLHRSLIENGIAGNLRALTLAPCCYHRTAQLYAYTPFSEAGRRCRLPLDRSDLRMVAQETVVAGRGVRNKRRQEVSFRLGFDALQRSLSGRDAYLNVPNLPKTILRRGFEGFCRWAAEKKAFRVPEGVDFEHWEAVGALRFRTIDRLELVRGLFRRPLEVWLILDQAAALAEAGYHVKVHEFCDRLVTPRNLIIHAEKN